MGRLLTIAAVLAIAALTLMPLPGQESTSAPTPFSCIVCGTHGGVDVVLNVILFVPFGLGLVLAGVRLRAALVATALFTLCIELLQSHVIPGRDASLSDLLTNSIGGMLGALLAARLPSWLAPTPAHARRLGSAAAAAWLLVQGVTAWSVGVTLPGSPQWFGQHRPVSDLFPSDFEGRVLGARLGDVEVPDSPIRDAARARRALQGGTPLEAHIVAGPPTPWTAAIVRITDDDHDEAITLGQFRGSLFLRVGMRASTLRLRVPPVRLDDAFPARDDAPLHIAGAWRDRHLELRVNDGARTHVARIAPSPSWGWSLVLPLENYAMGDEARWLTMLWIAGLLAPAGFWLRGAFASPTRAATALAITILLGLGAVPLLARLAPVHGSEWLAALAGSGTGAAAHALAARRRAPTTARQELTRRVGTGGHARTPTSE